MSSRKRPVPQRKKMPEGMVIDGGVTIQVAGWKLALEKIYGRPTQKIGKLEGYEFKHYTVNRSESFIDPSTGAHTQSVESLWASAKGRNKAEDETKRSLLDSYVCEFMWRHRNKYNNLFEGKRKEVTARAKLKALVRKVVDASSWLAPMLKQHREGRIGEDRWFSLEEKLCLLGREEDRTDVLINKISKKIFFLIEFMDYNYDIVRQLVQVGRFVAFGSGRPLFRAGDDSRYAYLILEGCLTLEDANPSSLPLQVLSRVENPFPRKLPPEVKQKYFYVKEKSVVGDQDIIWGRRRTVNAIAKGPVELVCFEKDHLLKILHPVIKKWEDVTNDLRKYRIFKLLDKSVLKDIVKFAKYVSFRPRKYIKMDMNEGGKTDLCYFLLYGRCQVIERLLVARDDTQKGFDRFKLYFWQDQIDYPDWVEPVYMRVCYLEKGAFFGLGERLSKSHIFTETPCRFLTLPNKLITQLKSKLPALEEALQLLDEVYPKTIDVFLTYVYGRLSHDFSSNATRECRVKTTNPNTIHDVPLTLRATHLRMKPAALNSIHNHPDYLVGRDIHDVIKEERKRKKAYNELNNRRENSFKRYENVNSVLGTVKMKHIKH